MTSGDVHPTSAVRPRHEPDAASPPPRACTSFGDVVALAIWSSVVFGTAEGAVFCFTRRFPLLQAAHKLPNEVLWGAALVDLPLFLVGGTVLWLAGKLVPVRLLDRVPGLTLAAFVMGGTATVIMSPGLIDQKASVVLGLGIAALVHRRLRGRADRAIAAARRRLPWAAAIFVATILSVAVSQWSAAAIAVARLPAPTAGAPNVLVIVLDTVRADRFELPAGARLTPNLDRLAEQGVTYANAWSTTSWSLPSQASILTGELPFEHDADWPSLKMRDDAPCLPEFFASRGYVTGAFSGNAAWITPEYLGRGFVRFQTYVAEDVLRRTVHGRRIDEQLDKIGFNSAARGKKAPTVNAQFLAFLDDYPDRPFFAYLCYMDVNQALHDRMLNYADRNKAPAREIAAASDHGLAALDTDIGDLIAALEKRGVLRNTLVVVVSDHGESFGDDGTRSDHNPGDHATSLYPEQARVPMSVTFPGKAPAGARVDDAVSIAQIPATVASLIGAGGFPGRPLPLSSAVAGTSPSAVLATLRYHDPGDFAQSVVSGRRQLIRILRERKWLTVGDELYDLAADPRAWTNLASVASESVDAERLKALLREMRGDEPAGAGPRKR